MMKLEGVECNGYIVPRSESYIWALAKPVRPVRLE